MHHAQKTALLLGLLPVHIYAAGYYLPNQDAFATAKGNAFVATADNASAVFYNPAGLTQLDSLESQVGFYSIMMGSEAKVRGVTDKADREVQVAPHLYLAGPVSDRISMGFSINSPFGLGTDWGRDTPFSPVITEARLMYISGTAAVAYKVTDELSIGAGFSVNRADLTLEQGLGVPGSYLRFEGDDYGVSGSIGVRWQPTERHAFGLNYTTKSTFDLEGRTHSNFLPGASADLDFMTPARAAVGYSFRPAKGWNIEANIEWVDWDALNTLTLRSATVGGEVAVPFEWKSSFIYEVGVSYTTESGYVFAAGYDYNSSAQPSEFFNPGVADADRHWLNMGVGRKGEANDWMVTYQFGFSDRTVNNATGVNSLANGKYEARHHALMFSWQHRF